MSVPMGDTPPVMLADLTWTEVKRYVESDAVVLLPVGAFEQHGPGMTLETDTRLASELCRLVSVRLFPRVLVAPAVPWGLSDHHLGFAGTISLHPETFFLLIQDVITSLVGHGFRRFVLVNGHGGNMTACEEACVRLREETTADVVAAVTYFTLIPLPVLEHAGEIETSFSLALDPQLVRPDRLVPAAMTVSDHASPDALRGRPFHHITATGNLGDPRRATSERGKQLVDAVLARLCEIVTSLDRNEGPAHALNGRGRKEANHGAGTG